MKQYLDDYFSEQHKFYINNVDLDMIKDEANFLYSLYQYEGHKAIMENDNEARKKSISAYCAAETLKAVLALSVESDTKTFKYILDRLTYQEPIITTRTLNFVANE